MNDDGLDALSDAKLTEIFAVENAGWSKRSEGLLWHEEDRIGRIIPGSHLEAVRRKMGLPIDCVLVPDYCTDATAVLPFLMRYRWEARYSGGNHVFIDIGNRMMGEAQTFTRAVVIALIRAKRAARPVGDGKAGGNVTTGNESIRTNKP